MKKISLIKLFFITLQFLFITIHAHAQGSFARMIPNNFRPAWVHAESDGNIFIYGDGNYISSLDNNGNARWMKKYPALRTIDCITKLTSGNLLAAYCRNDTSPNFKTHPGIMLLDSMGTVQWSKEDTSTHSDASTRFRQQFHLKGNEIMWIQQYGSFANLFKIDTNGTIYSQHSLYLPMDRSIWAPDNYLYCSSSSSTVYDKVDTAGNILWIKIYPAGNPQVVSDICRAGNYFYLCGYYYPHYPSFYPSMPLLHKIDAAGNILDTKVIALHDTSLGINERILPSADGGFIITSWRQQNRMAVIKTDSAFTQVTAWHNINDIYQVHDAALTADGGFVLNAFHTSAQFTNKILVLKTNAGANLAPCFSSLAIDSVFNLPSASTDIFSTSAVLNVTYLPSNVIDSAYALTAQQFCITIGDDEYIQPSFSVYPNPAHHTINIHFDDNSPKEIALFNMMGEEVFHSAINNASNQYAADISKRSAGIYLLKVTERNKVSAARVAVE